MFERIVTTSEDKRKVIHFSFNGELITAKTGDTVAAALLNAGIRAFRQSPVSGNPRGPFCMMGACFECVVEVNDEKVQACMTSVASGMEINIPATLADHEEAQDDTL